MDGHAGKTIALGLSEREKANQANHKAVGFSKSCSRRSWFLTEKIHMAMQTMP